MMVHCLLNCRKEARHSQAGFLSSISHKQPSIFNSRLSSAGISTCFLPLTYLPVNSQAGPSAAFYKAADPAQNTGLARNS